MSEDREFGIEQARKILGDIADAAEQGAVTHLTRNGRRVATIHPPFEDEQRHLDKGWDRIAEQVRQEIRSAIREREMEDVADRLRHMGLSEAQIQQAFGKVTRDQARTDSAHSLVWDSVHQSPSQALEDSLKEAERRDVSEEVRGHDTLS